MFNDVRALAITALVLASPIGVLADERTDRQRQIYQEAVANPNSQAKVDALIASLVEAPPGSGRFLVEGDILLSRNEITSYLKDLRDPAAPQLKSEELILHAPGGRLDYITDPAKRKMRYRLDAASFPSTQAGQFVERNFRDAGKEWERACPECGIEFQMSTAEDRGPVSFIVKFENVPGGPIARAFFPSSAPDDRVVAIFPGYLASNLEFDPVGVLRHEIGHILGYRHEHIRNIPGCLQEGSEYLPITPYTPKSVMHYFCGGAGSFDLKIRAEDQRGHSCVYLTGRPCLP